MGIHIRRVGRLAAIVVLFNLAPAALAQTSVSMTLTSAGSNILNGVYVNPYTANINGVSTTVICDDYADESGINESWTATVTNFSNLSNTRNTTKWGLTSAQQTQDYEEAAWLTLQLLNPNTTCPNTNADCTGDISYAIWQIFDSSAFGALGTSSPTNYNLLNAQYWLGLAQSEYNNHQLSLGEFSNFLVYSPTGNYQNCPTTPCTPPQEFFSITASESPTLVMLGTDLLGLLALIVVLRRRRVYTAN